MRTASVYVVLERAQKRKPPPARLCLRLVFRPHRLRPGRSVFFPPVGRLFTNVASIHARGSDGNPPSIFETLLLL